MDYAAQLAVLPPGAFAEAACRLRGDAGGRGCRRAPGGDPRPCCYCPALSPNPLLPGTVFAYVELMRNTPLLLQIYLIYFGLPLIGLFPSEFICGVIGIALQHAAFLSEIYRGAIESVSQRQREAARAIGMRRLEAFRHIILPQALIKVLGPIANQLIVLIKDTSLVSAIGIMELTLMGKVIDRAQRRLFRDLHCHCAVLSGD